VQASGAVVTGRGSTTSRGEPVMSSDTIAGAIRDAAKDPEIEAIVFRIDSPGGSPLASDLIWRAVRDARDQGKPVIASLSSAAASGGYYVASAADRIVSQPTTFTGSIGVFVIRPAVGGLLEKLGVGVEAITRGARADLLLSADQLSPGARDVLQRDVQAVYDLFVSRVSEGRGLPPERVDELGRGRVWTGAQALENGLVDALGGVHEAVREAKEQVGIEADADVLLIPFPQPQQLADQVSELLRTGLRAAAPTLPTPGSLAAAGVPMPGSLHRLLAAAAELPKGTPLLIPAAWVEVR
jgi:protease-4